MKSMKVLLVDDEVDFVSTLAERLQLRGVETITATDGETALDLIEKDPPEVVVLDVMMPGIGGVDVLNRIKARHPKLPVILLTGHGSINTGVAGLKQGAFEYLVKPVNIEELMKKLQEALEHI